MSKPEKLGGGVFLYPGDCLKSLDRMKENSVDAVVTDPPYHLTSIVKRFGSVDISDQTKTSERSRNRSDSYARLAAGGFMGQTWDGGDVAFRKETWEKVFRVMKPGAHLIAFCGTRNYHRLACAIEDAGFEVRDAISWMYGTGFPKSHDVSKGIDRAKGAKRKVVGKWKQPGRGKRNKEQKYGLTNDSGEITEPKSPEAQQWDGWGTSLKPAMELMCMARKPLSEKTVAANVLKWGTGVLNIDGCRVNSGPVEKHVRTANVTGANSMAGVSTGSTGSGEFVEGRWPANVTHDGSDEVVGSFPQADSARASGNPNNPRHGSKNRSATSYDWNPETESHDYRDTGSAARFFFSAKAGADDRIGFEHPTVKPIDLMQWLVRMITPQGGYVLDPFAGTGTTGEAAWRERCKAILMEAESKHQGMIRRRVEVMLKGTYEREIAKMSRKTADTGTLFVT